MSVGGSDERFDCGDVWQFFRPELYVPHLASAALQQAGRVRQFGAEEESEVHVGSKNAYVGQCRVTDAGGGVAVMHQFANVAIAAVTQGRKPPAGDGAQFRGLAVEECIDGRVVCSCA